VREKRFGATAYHSEKLDIKAGVNQTACMIRLPPKAVGMLCLLQVFAIVLGYSLTRSAYKFYPMVVEMAGSAELVRPLTWATRLMLAMGPWLLALPFGWGTAATLTANLDGGIAELSERQTRIGYILSGGVAMFCYFSVVQMWDSLTHMR
jgi:hypothetical protein